MSEGCTTPLSHPLWLLEWIALHHAFLFWTNDASKPLTARSFFIHCNYVFLGRPLGLLPVAIVLSTFLGHVSGSKRWTWPYQRRRPNCWYGHHVQRKKVKPDIHVVRESWKTSGWWFHFWKVILFSLHIRGGSQNSQNPTRRDKIRILFSKQLY